VLDQLQEAGQGAHLDLETGQDLDLESAPRRPQQDLDLTS
jgi:hypothetical protein